MNCVERPELAEKLGVETIPALVVVEGRRVRARLEGLGGCREIEQLLEPWIGLAEADESPADEPADTGEDTDDALTVSGAPGQTVDRVTMALPADLSFDRWRSIGRRICGVADASSWWLADWVAYGEERYGEKYREAVEITGVGYQTLRNYAWVARRFDVSRRRDSLSFAHHSEVAALPPATQDEWLDRAEERGWSRNDLRAALKGLRASQDDVELEHLRLEVSSSRAERWRSAARAGGLDLPDWLVVVADDASAA